VPKEQRIERMRPDFEAGRFKLPRFKEMDGHKAVLHPRRGAIRALTDQFDTMTGEGAAGHDDLLDALEMLHRIAPRAPRRNPCLPSGRKILEDWERKGITVDPLMAHQQNWTKRMRDDFDSRVQPSLNEAGAIVDAFV
jgi:hypothetical protein